MNYGCSKHLKRLNLVQNKKEQNRRPEPRKHTKDPSLTIVMFFTYMFFGSGDFFDNFWIAPKGPLQFVRYFATKWMLKKPKTFPFLHFLALGHNPKFSFLIFFSKTSQCLQMAPLQFIRFFLFRIFKKPKGSLFYKFCHCEIFQNGFSF